MSEFQFYKRRNFNAYVNDSMQFFKLFGKNYFKTYITINGGLLLIMCGLFYFTFKDLMGSIMGLGAGNNWLFEDSNVVLMISLFSLFTIVSVLMSIISIGQPLVYMQLMETTGRNEFTPSELLSGIMKVAGRIFAFGLISLFVIMPVFFILAIIGVLLSLILIGIPVLIIGVPALMVWAFQALILYVYEDQNYFEALGNAWAIIFSNFWHIIGSSIVIYLIIYIIQSAISMVPYFMMIGSIVTSGSAPVNDQISPFLIVIYVLSFVVSFFLINVVYVQQVLIYYSASEDSEHFQAISDIDNIGVTEA